MTHVRRWIGGLALFATASSAALFARADKPVASASASGSATAIPLRDLRKRPPPTVASDHPKPDEWKSAEPVALARELPRNCNAKLVREWLRIWCEAFQPQSGAVLTGNPDDVYFFMVSGQTRGIASLGRDFQGYVTVELPLRRGDQRLIQITEAATLDYGGLGPQQVTILLSVRWLDDEAGPTVTVGGR